jgi:hypothetical protein
MYQVPGFEWDFELEDDLRPLPSPSTNLNKFKSCSGPPLLSY